MTVGKGDTRRISAYTNLFAELLASVISRDTFGLTLKTNFTRVRGHSLEEGRSGVGKQAISPSRGYIV